MANVFVNEKSLNAIANSIRAKNGEAAKYKPSEMATAIDKLPAGGGGTELNIEYGDVAPEDTTKLWINGQKPTNIVADTNVDFLKGTNSVKLLTTKLPNDQDSSCSAAVGENIYIFGGYILVQGKIIGLDTTLKFNTKTQTISQVHSLPKALAYSRAVAVGTDIYVIAGQNSRTIYRYDTVLDRYFTQNSSLNKEDTHLSVAIGTSIYMLVDDKIFIYDTKTDTIKLQSKRLPVYVALSSHAICEMGTDIYIFDENYSEIYKLDTVTLNTQKLSTKLPESIKYRSIAAIGSNIYLLTGAENNNRVGTITKFNTKDFSVEILPETIPVPVGDSTGTAVGTTIYVFGGRTNKVKVDDIQTFSVDAALQNNDVYIYHGYKPSNSFSLVKSEKIDFKIDPIDVYRGDSNNIAQRETAKLYKNGQWVVI